MSLHGQGMPDGGGGWKASGCGLPGSKADWLCVFAPGGGLWGAGGVAASQP